MAIKRIESKPDTQFSAVALYLNDIEDIQAAIRHVHGDEAVFIFGDGEYTYDSLDELVKQRGAKTIRYLEISAKGKDYSSVRLVIAGRLGHNELCVLNFKDTGKQAELYFAIREILDHRKRRIASFQNFLSPWAVPPMIVVIVLIVGALAPHSPWLALPILAVMVGYVSLGVFSQLASFGWSSRVYLFHPHEKPNSFIRHHSETIIVAVITSILTASLTYFVPRLLNSFTNGPTQSTATQPQDKTTKQP